MSDMFDAIRQSQKFAERMLKPYESGSGLQLEKLDLRNYQLADYQFEILRDSIESFESELDDDHEVAVKLASFGQSILMQVTNIGYSNPAVIHFYGFVNGQKSELIQHVSQLNFLLTAVPKSNPNLPARRIGFTVEEDHN